LLCRLPSVLGSLLESFASSSFSGRLQTRIPWTGPASPACCDLCAFCLWQVILALTAGQAHVPYRDSKLTRLLRDSLGGTSRALLLVCLVRPSLHP
jgi:hypothetical protein